MFSHPDERGETMSALKKRAPEHDHQFGQPTRQIPPADYTDEVTEEQLKAVRDKIGGEFDEWEVVDGPAW